MVDHKFLASIPPKVLKSIPCLTAFSNRPDGSDPFTTEDSSCISQLADIKTPQERCG